MVGLGLEGKPETTNDPSLRKKQSAALTPASFFHSQKNRPIKFPFIVLFCREIPNLKNARFLLAEEKKSKPPELGREKPTLTKRVHISHGTETEATTEPPFPVSNRAHKTKCRR
ncbi:hypothetical protein RUM43_011531 [Polyplax serrata]|uniref:Uncharacterized protein n=1 Tax=Polyplax serrata TaxID=468196 RepID=A0AAN8S0C6_POLSC